MRIVCPDCATAYEVPEARLSPGMMARCARCAREWVPLDAAVAPEPPPLEAAAELARQAAAEAESETALATVTDEAAAEDAAWADREPLLRPVDDPVDVHPRRAGLALAWAASVVVLLGAIWGAYVERDLIMRRWPPSERAYVSLGLAPRR